MKRNIIYIQEDNPSVQDFYVSVIASAFTKIGYGTCKTIHIKDISKISKDDIIITISHYSVVKLYFKGYRKIVYWVQGSSSDESFMRNHSYLRKYIISCIELFSLKVCKCCFMVSKAMLNYYNSKYHCDFSYKTYLMPCFNSEVQKDLFFSDGKYINNTFCYVGGLSVWQCFPETVDIYKKIESSMPDTCLKVFTAEREKAIKILQDKEVSKYEVNYVTPDKLVNELAKCKFGFILRSKSPVNYVATPTKLSNYMAAGLIPIVSNSVGFFGEVFKNSYYSIVLDELNLSDDNINKIMNFSKQSIDPSDVLKEFTETFNLYYNTNNHINQIADFLRSVNVFK